MNASSVSAARTEARPEAPSGRAALAAGGIAAILASACCVGPLVLVMLGASGAWIGNLTLLEPYRPFFIGAALVALALAWRRIYRPAADCKPGEMCAIPRVRTSYRVLFWVVALLVAAAIAFPYVAPWFY
ncbi:MAG: mercuric ion transporter MerT [Burkholderiaceae bacterium]